ncbi:condensin complex subunit 2-like [Glossina fuscipes]|uniref:Condensin complex subunit 2 n=1 Tax=Glossina fuscipes TaxID=7396 RepID=A0A9C6DTP3_9MUSC|nr:condensin complex subunit 2-like [Glossina fuscipes]KAI9580929.1 hypothetical protein GQX74_013477 [Glossina fuscipes]
MASDHEKSPVTPVSSLCQESNISDDAEKREEAKDENVESSFTESETLQNDLEIYNNNLGRENAWSLSLIDTLSTLLDNHHKTVNNFISAGNCLEASSKIYSIRVDSIYLSVLRTLAALNAQKFRERLVDNVDDGGETVTDLAASVAGVELIRENPKKAKRKRIRPTTCTVTKNRETLNACLDTAELLHQDPVFAKFNSIACFGQGLMNNILLTTESELLLHTTFIVWDKAALPPRDYTEEISLQTYNEDELSPCDHLFEMQNLENLKLRPLQSGYIITNAPKPTTQDMGHDLNRLYRTDSDNGTSFAPQQIRGRETQTVNSRFGNVDGTCMAFDMSSECEPIPMNAEPMLIANVNCYELNGLAQEELSAINNCRSLSTSAIVIDDLHPVDASDLEYSYRPLKKILHFWAGPRYWKFKRCPSEAVAWPVLNPRAACPRQNMKRKKAKQLTFDQLNEELFVPLDEKYKNRKLNLKRRGDHEKLKFPMDMQLTKDRFSNFTLAPGLALSGYSTYKSALHSDNNSRENFRVNGLGEGKGGQFTDDHEDRNGIENLLCNNFSVVHDEMELVENNSLNSTILEIPNDFEGAPAQVTRITVPFARRAKVIDMDNLKRICWALLNKEFKKSMHEAGEPRQPILNDERYEDGMASFNEIYAQLPQLLPRDISKNVSTSIAFSSMLQLANEHDLRLVPQEDLTDFKIRKLAD